MLPNDVWIEDTLFLGTQYEYWVAIILLCLLIGFGHAASRGPQ
jgi:hypothetical protein